MRMENSRAITSRACWGLPHSHSMQAVQLALDLNRASMTPPRWSLGLIIIASLVAAGALASIAVTSARGRWLVAEYESRGPNRYSRVLVNDRSGEVCELNRNGSNPTDPSLGEHPFWMCSRPARGGQPFMP